MNCIKVVKADSTHNPAPRRGLAARTWALALRGRAPTLALPVAATLFAVLSVFANLRVHEQQMALDARTALSARVLHATDALQRDLRASQTATRAYALTGQRLYKTQFDAAVLAVGEDMSELEAVTRAEAPRLSYERLEPLVNAGLRELRSSVQARDTGGLEAAVASVRAEVSTSVQDLAKNEISDLQSREVGALTDTRRDVEARARAATTVGVAALAMAFLAGGGAGLAAVAATRRAHEKLSGEREFHAHVMDVLGQGVVVTDALLNVTYANPAVNAMLERPHVPGASAVRALSPGDQPRVELELLAALNDATRTFEASLMTAGGGERHVLVSATPLARGSATGVVVVLTDLTERRAVELALDAARHEAEALLEIGKLLDETLEARDVTPQVITALARVVPFDAAYLIKSRRGVACAGRIGSAEGDAPCPRRLSRELAALVSNSHAPVYLDGPCDAVNAPGSASTGAFTALYPLVNAETSIAIAVTRLASRPFNDRERRILEAAARAGRNAATREQLLQGAHHAALHDPLTGLLNRRALDADLERALRDARQEGRPLTVMVLDLDGMKLINDTQGHERGDTLLRAFAARLRANYRSADLAYRTGGDEFAMIFPGGDRQTIQSTLGKLQAAVQGVREAGFPGIDASVGLAGADDGDTPGELLRVADTRMYADKRTRKHAPREPVSQGA